MGRKIRVLVIDDSAIVRKLLTESLAAVPEIEVVGTAPDPIIAEAKIRTLNPDVLTLDIEMPRMDGITFLRKLMQERPLPVIIISSLGQAGCRAAMDAMHAGAVEVLAKPGGPYSVGDLRAQLPGKIRAAASARLRKAATPFQEPPPAAAPVLFDRMSGAVIAIGASTGGTEAIHVVLRQFPANSPPIVITQHIPPVFSRAFADRLNGVCQVEVREAIDNELAPSGTALVAPGGYHMLLRRTPDGYRVTVKDGPQVCYQRPSVDVLFRSVADAAGSKAVGVILTGMGNDGAEGLLKIRQAGGRTIAQDEATCVVYGMPREAVRLGAVERTLPLPRIAAGIASALEVRRAG